MANFYMTRKMVSIHEAAEFLGVTAQTLRRWEREGKLVPGERTPGGRRRYDLARLRPEQFHVADVARRTIAYARVSSHDQKDDSCQRLDPATDGRLDPRSNVRENEPILGNLVNDFDSNQPPARRRSCRSTRRRRWCRGRSRRPPPRGQAGAMTREPRPCRTAGDEALGIGQETGVVAAVRIVAGRVAAVAGLDPVAPVRRSEGSADRGAVFRGVLAVWGPLAVRGRLHHHE